MFKLFATLIRGRAHDVAECISDQNALPILNQQIRDCVVAVEQARKAVAFAMAQNRQEVEQQNRLIDRINDLEKRTVDAMEQGKDALAREAAEAIAVLEDERDANAEAQAHFQKDIAALKKRVALAEMRLRQLKQGQRIAAASNKAQALRTTLPAGDGLNTLKDAEDTLSRLRERQQQINLADQALEEMDSTRNPAKIAERLAAEGCGKPLKSSADEVLERLSKQRSQPQQQPQQPQQTAQQ